MWQDSLWGWRLSCRYKNYDYVQVLKHHVLLKYKFFYWFFRWFIFRWSEVPQEVFEMRELQKEAGLELCCHHGPEVVLHCMHEKEQVAGGAQNPPRHQGYRSSRWKRLPKVPCHNIGVKKIRNFFASHMLGSFPEPSGWSGLFGTCADGSEIFIQSYKLTNFVLLTCLDVLT